MGVERAVRVPDIGDFENVEIIEVLVAVGDRIEADTSLVTLESDKATMEVPSPFAGVVNKVCVAVGDHVVIFCRENRTILVRNGILVDESLERKRLPSHIKGISSDFTPESAGANNDEVSIAQILNQN